MAITPIKIAALRPSKSPNLLIAPVEYSQGYQDMLLNALRLYFNQIDSFTQAASIPDVGTTTQRPTLDLKIGQTFFDTDLGTHGLPIWWDGFNWINASGTTV
jgi:hypothetical protein